MTTLYPTANHYLSRDHHTQSFGSEFSPALRVSAGDQIHVQTWDCFKGQVLVDADLTKVIDDSQVNPATGPIYVEGAEQGDTLAVTIIDIKTEARGVARFSAGEGQLHQKATGPYGTF